MINHLFLSYFLLPLQCERKYETKVLSYGNMQV